MANRRPPWKIPAVINPHERRCIQINIPEDPEHIAIFWGVLRGLSDWQRWEREPTKSATLVAQVWREVVYAIDWEDSCMGCCEDRIVLHRVTEGGAMEISTDDGTTWTPDPDDPRTTGTHLPNTIPGEADGKKCNAATNAIANFKDAQASFGHSLTSATTVIGLALAFAAEILLLVLSAGTAAEVLVPLMIATATGLFGVLEADYNAEFTEAVWDDLTCDIFCTIGEDGQFNESQLINLQARVDANYSDNVALTFQSILRGWGTLGLNNACISGVAATADCSDCDCPDCPCDPYGWVWSPAYGTPEGQDFVRALETCAFGATPWQNPDNDLYYWGIKSESACNMAGGITSGSVNVFHGYISFDHVGSYSWFDTSTEWSSGIIPGPRNCKAIIMVSSVPFTPYAAMV